MANTLILGNRTRRTSIYKPPVSALGPVKSTSLSDFMSLPRMNSINSKSKMIKILVLQLGLDSKRKGIGVDTYLSPLKLFWHISKFNVDGATNKFKNKLRVNFIRCSWNVPIHKTFLRSDSFMELKELILLSARWNVRNTGADGVLLFKIPRCLRESLELSFNGLKPNFYEFHPWELSINLLVIV